MTDTTAITVDFKGPEPVIALFRRLIRESGLTKVAGVTTNITTPGLTGAEHQLRITYLAAIAGYITNFEELRYYTGDALRSDVVASIRADHAALEAWYELLMDLRADLTDIAGTEEYTPAVGVFVAEEIARYDATRARFNDLVVHWLVKGTPVHYDEFSDLGGSASRSCDREAGSSSDLLGAVEQ